MARSCSRTRATSGRCGWPSRRSWATAWPSWSTRAPTDSDTGAMITRVGEGEAITTLERREVILLADHEEISITRSRYGPGQRGPDPHVHREHTDSFYVLEGELRFEVGPDLGPVRVGPGGFVAAPANVVHTFVNDG